MMRAACGAKSSKILGLALAFLVGCGDVGPIDHADVAVAAEEIVNGSFDSGDPFAVALLGNDQLTCSGTLIRPTIVLTAAHCTPPNISEFGVFEFHQMSVFFGSDVFAGGQVIDVIDGWAHPGWNIDVVEHDIALLRLAQPAPVAPIPFNVEPMTSQHVGTSLRIIGFGQTNANDPSSIGRKYQGTSVVDGVYPSVLTMPMQPGITCNGDSGGTTLMDQNGQEVVVGVHSRSDCVSGAIDTRPDEYTDEIYAFLGESPVNPGCGLDGQCGVNCGAVDLDCPCHADGQCTSACAEPATDPDCNPGCGSDGICATEGCNLPDPDCDAPCEADGICDDSCVADPDCPPLEGEWTAGDLEAKDYDGALLDSGCSYAAPRRSSPWWAAGLGLVLLARRRRHRRAM